MNRFGLTNLNRAISVLAARELRCVLFVHPGFDRAFPLTCVRSWTVLTRGVGTVFCVGSGTTRTGRRVRRACNGH